MELKKLGSRLWTPQIQIGKAEVGFRRHGKGGPLFADEYIILRYPEILEITYPAENNHFKILAFRTSTQIYHVDLVLRTEEKKIVYKLLQSTIETFFRELDFIYVGDHPIGTVELFMNMVSYMIFNQTLLLAFSLILAVILCQKEYHRDFVYANSLQKCLINFSFYTILFIILLFALC